MESSGGETEIQPNQERLSEETARSKLTILENPDFKDFAVRFMGIKEYRRFFENGILEGREATIFGKERARRLMNENTWQPSFREYVESAQKRRHGWEDVAYDQTNWPESNLDMTAYNKLIEELKKTHREASGNPDKRVAVLEKFREKVTPWIHSVIPMRNAVNNYGDLKLMASEDFPEINMQDVVNESDKVENFEDRQEVFQRFFPNSSDTLQRQWRLLQTKLVESNTDAGNVAIIDDFLSDEEYLTRDRENLRKVINAIAFGPKLSRQSSQYHVALILDIEGAAVGGASLQRSWGYLGGLKDYKDQPTYKKERAVIGAIATVPNKEIFQEMTELSSHSGSIAHPIFDAQGVVRWPRQVKS
jgi:hypothetical protein